MSEIAPIRNSAAVPVSADVAFDVFTAHFGSWWPAEFTWSQPDLLESIGMQYRLGGMLTEIGPAGFRMDWGRITTWEPASSFSFLWQISPDRVPVPNPDQASIVDVSFVSLQDECEVTVTHHSWERHGPQCAAYRADFAYAWPMALDRYRQQASK